MLFISAGGIPLFIEMKEDGNYKEILNISSK
jgi:hypothetical protein